MARSTTKTDRVQKGRNVSGAIKPGEAGWQAEKSAITRQAIMQAAVKCLIDHGYTQTTTSLIAEYAGVSRGAMMHHFPSRISVIAAVVGYLHDVRLSESQELIEGADKRDALSGPEVIEEGVRIAWQYVNLPSFVAYQELMFASRTDEELKDLVIPVEKDFEQQFLDVAKEVFPHWSDAQNANLEAAHDLVQFLMKGMALSHMSARRKERSQKVIDLLISMLKQMFERGV